MSRAACLALNITVLGSDDSEAHENANSPCVIRACTRPAHTPPHPHPITHTNMYTYVCKWACIHGPVRPFPLSYCPHSARYPVSAELARQPQAHPSSRAACRRARARTYSPLPRTRRGLRP